ncbi:MAG: hypothetical protein LBK83_11655 [Treponema sp.]|nr:hypothetical protein [Treponema sp.]
MDRSTKQRYISTSIWSDDWFDSLSEREKLVYFYLLTNEHTNPAGVYQCTLKNVRLEIGLDREEIERIMTKFSTAGKAFYYREYIIIPKWLKHQKIKERSGLFAGVVKVIRGLPDAIKAFISDRSHYDFDVTPYMGPSLDPPPENGGGSQEGPPPIPLISAHDLDLDLDSDLDSDSDIEREEFNAEKIPEPPQEPPEDLSSSTAVAVAPKKSRKIELTDTQLLLFHAAKACFESSERAKAIIYQDLQTTAREMRNLKTLVIRCSNMAPEVTADFMRGILEHFRTLINGKLRGKAVFTPRSLITPWIWELVVDSLPENDLTDEFRESVRELFRNKG